MATNNTAPVFDPNAGYAPAATSVPPQANRSTGAAPVFDPNAAYAPADQTQQTSVSTTSTPGTLSNIGSGLGEAAGDIWGAAKGMIPGTDQLKTIWNSLPPVQQYENFADSTKQVLPLINAYHEARSNGASIGDAIKAVDNAARQHTSNINPLKPVVDAFRANPTRETARAVTDAAALAASMFVPGAIASAVAPEAEAATAAKAASEVEALRPPNPFRRALQSPEVKGERIAQPIAQAGVKAAAPTVGASLRSGIDVDTPFAEAKTLYRTVDNAAKTNFQDLYTKLDGAQDDARQAASGSPEEAKAQQDVLNTQHAIDDAKAIAAKSGVPDVDKMLAQADAKFTTAQANKDLNSKFFGSNSVVKGNIVHGAPETIDVDNAINTLENLDKKNKFGVSRLRQTSLGDAGADKLKQAMYDAQKAGEKAMDSRVLRNTLAKLAGAGTGLEVLHLFAK